MNYISLGFFAFICIFLIVYYIVPQRYRYILITVGSYFFYGYADFKLLTVLMMITILTYIGGIILQTQRTKLMYAVFVILTLLILVYFKYTNFIVQNINWLLEGVVKNSSYRIASLDLILPVGLSFIVFQACTYLGDIYRGKLIAEKNIVRYAAFVAFFPTVLSGPIQKARELLPQIKSPLFFDPDTAKKGTILFVWGTFEKVMVANRLLVVVNKVFDNYGNYNSAYYVVAAICFSLYIYADFAAYSDMARGIAMLMGIHIGKNFDNPYLSQSTAEFWNRWHMSLNSWFVENVYIPLGGNRKGIIRKYINVLIVFFLSGLWHGAEWHYIVWGVINGILVIVGQITKPLTKKIYSAWNVDEKVDSIKYMRRIIVFVLITLTWIFFYKNIYASFEIVKSIVTSSPINFFNPDLFSISGTVAATFVTFVTTMLFTRVQLKRQNESLEYKRYCMQPFLFQILILGMMICVCVFGACSTDANVNTQFLYFQF